MELIPPPKNTFWDAETFSAPCVFFPALLPRREKILRDMRNLTPG